VPEQPPQINLMSLLGIGAMFGVCIGLGVFLGVLGDREWGTSPLLSLVGTAVGIVGGAAGAYQAIRPYTRTSSTSSPTTESARPDDDVRSDEQ
jgi:F0F1-type ATP synthase assembly protein I